MYNVCLVGFGAIGALYGFAIEQSGKAHLTIVCRSNYSTIQEHGVLTGSYPCRPFEWEGPILAVGRGV